VRARISFASVLRYATAVLLDTLLLLLLLIVAFIVLSGGGEFVVNGQRISVRTIGNPLLFANAILLLRIVFFRRVPLFLHRTWYLDDLAYSARRQVSRLEHLLVSSAALRGTGYLAALIALATAVKLANAYAYPGFFSGDDVEVHEMTFASLFGYDWHAWNLRSSFYPFVFIRPVQSLLVLCGIESTEVLVLAGRCVVALVSSIGIWLTYRLTRVLAGPAYGLFAAALFAIHRLHVTFGGSELPRPVSTVFVLGACLLLYERGSLRTSIAGGALLGIGASLRYSELVFIVPAVFDLALRRRYLQLCACVMTFAVVMSACVAAADALYWGDPLFSLENAFRYTVVDRLSSRGYEPPFHYITSMTQWTSLPVFVCAIVGCFGRSRPVALWWVLPLAILSALPHKEARYLVPILPFYCIGAALGCGRLARTIVNGYSVHWRIPAQWAAFWFLVLFSSALVFEVGGWRFRKSSDGIVAARHVANVGCSGTVAFEQSWRGGGRLYLRPCDVRDIDPERAGDIAYLRTIVQPPDVEWVVLRTRGSDAARRALEREFGFAFQPVPEATGYVAARRTLHTSALVSMIRTFGSSEIAIRSLTTSPRTSPRPPK
jgi:hypothetical protein